MKTSLALTSESKAEEVLELPQGRLMIGDFLATFSPESVVEAARALIAHCQHNDFGEFTFVSQAGVIAEAVNTTVWNNRPEYKTI